MSDGFCVFNTQYGSAIKVDVKDINNLSTDNEYEITFISGEKIKGKLISKDTNKTVLISESFGNVEINPANISALVKIFPQREATSTTQNTFGEKEEESPPLDFLTDSTVLLSPGVYELEMGLMYKQSRQENSLMNVGYFQRSAFLARKIELAITGRAGLYDRLECWLTTPGTYTYIQDVSTNDYVRETDSWDLGDISFGLQYLLIPESEDFPAISITTGVNAPTGKMSYRKVGNTWQDPLNNGSGHWGASFGLSFVRTVDPAILFGGIDYNHSFPNTIDGYDIDHRWTTVSYFGVGFALNEKLSVGTRFGWGYSTTMTVDGNNIHGSDSEPMDLSFSASYRFFENWVTTPQVTFALNDDAGTPAISLKLARRF